jgi:hypothetical protein
MIESQYTDEPDDGRDNLFAPMPGTGRVAGLFGQRSKSTSVYTELFGSHPARGRIAAAVAALAIAWLVRKTGR